MVKLTSATLATISAISASPYPALRARCKSSSVIRPPGWSPRTRLWNSGALGGLRNRRGSQKRSRRYQSRILHLTLPLAEGAPQPPSPPGPGPVPFPGSCSLLPTGESPSRRIPEAPAGSTPAPSPPEAPRNRASPQLGLAPAPAGARARLRLRVTGPAPARPRLVLGWFPSPVLAPYFYSGESPSRRIPEAPRREHPPQGWAPHSPGPAPVSRASQAPSPTPGLVKRVLVPYL